MKEVNKISDYIYQILSEPGDATRYEYLMMPDGDGRYYFMPSKPSFMYPQYIELEEMDEYIMVKQLSNIEGTDCIIKLAEKFNCNPYTVMECVRSMQEHLKQEHLKGDWNE